MKQKKTKTNFMKVVYFMLITHTFVSWSALLSKISEIVKARDPVFLEKRMADMPKTSL